MSERCSSCGFADCTYAWQSGTLAEAAHGASVLTLLGHRYTADLPDDHCCESSGWCPHDGVGHEREPLEVRCTHCSVTVHRSKYGDLDLTGLFRSIADHEHTHHAPNEAK